MGVQHYTKEYLVKGIKKKQGTGLIPQTLLGSQPVTKAARWRPIRKFYSAAFFFFFGGWILNRTIVFPKKNNF